MILTDGVACSIILKRKDLIGKRYANMLQANRKKIPIQEQYIDDIDDEMRATLKGMNVAATDPNLSDLLYTVNSDEKDQVKFRYTQDSRRKETKAKKYRNYLQERKKEMVGKKSVEQWEAEMSKYNKKTVDFESFKKYVKQKNRLNRRLEPFYQEYIFRKLKLGSYMRRQITEARLIKRFIDVFGPPEETIFVIGDFDQKQHRKFKEPVKGRGFRKLFRNAGYLVFLVNEFRTSCRCSHCHGECETFRVCKNPRPYRDGSIKRHGLVKCKTCSRLWNRDTNAASNIWKIAMCAILGKPRPEYLCRSGS